MSSRIPEEDDCHRARNLCVISRIQKGTPGLTHKDASCSVYPTSIICDMIKRNDSDVSDIAFEIFAKTGQILLLYIVFSIDKFFITH